MIPFLTYPLALIGALAVPVLVAVYLFRTRFKRRTVSSLMLWKTVSQPREGGSRMRRLVAPLSFFLELLILALLLTAAVDPRWASSGARKPLMVVLDDSISMLARSGAVSARTRGMRAVTDMCARPDTGSTRFILAGKSPRLLEASGSPADVLKEWTCSSAGGCIEAAAALACEMSAGRGRVVVVTDHAPPAEFGEGKVQWRAFGNPLGNAGIVNAARSGGGQKDRCMIEVGGYFEAPVSKVLTVSFGAGLSPVRHSMSLATGEVKRLVFDIPRGAGEIHATLDDDALGADNRAILLPYPERQTRVLLEISDGRLDGLVKKALNASGMYKRAPVDPQVLITDSKLRAPDDPAMWVFRILGGDAALSYAGPYVLDAGHPLMNGIELGGAVWGVGSTNIAQGIPVLTVGNIPVLTERVFPSGRREFRMLFSPEYSTVQTTPAWPVIFWNLLNWRAGEAEGLSAVNVRTGVNPVLSLDEAPAEVALRKPDGSMMTLKGRKKLMLEATAPGVYSVDAGGQKFVFACNMLAPEESDLRNCASGTWGKWVDTEELKKEYAGTSWIFLALALGVMALHLYVVRK